MKSLPLLLALLSALALAPAARAEIPADVQGKIAEAYALYKKGAYNQALEAAGKVQTSDREAQAALALFEATVHGKMQSFDKAAAAFARAEKLGSKAENLHYDYGQALYALHHLDEARAEFRKSIVAKYKIAASAYYIGFIAQLKEDEKEAIDFYGRIQRLSQDPDKVKQPALFQMAEIEYGHVSALEGTEPKRAFLEKKVIPLYERARDFEKGTPTYDQAQTKIDEIEEKLNQLVPRMRNGIPLPRKPYTLKLTQDIQYNSNVITQADQALVSVSNKDSFVFGTSVLGKYQFNSKGIWSFIPEMLLSSTFHSRRGTPQVYANDNVLVAPAFRTKYEHTFHRKPASALFDVEFNYMLRDYTMAKKLPFYSRYWNFVAGERAKWFDTGTSTLKVGIKFYENEDPARNSYSPMISFTQNFKIAKEYDLSNTLSADYLHARANLNDERNYKLRSSTSLTKFFGNWDFNPSLSLALKDTMHQKATRGMEFLFNPSLQLSRDLTKKIGFDTSYDFTKNWSKSKTLYQYTQHVLKVSANCSF